VCAIQAKHYYTVAMEMAPESSTLLMGRAQCQFHMGEYGDVIADTGAVLKQDKNNMRAYFLRGQSYVVDFFLREFFVNVERTTKCRNTRCCPVLCIACLFEFSVGVCCFPNLLPRRLTVHCCGVFNLHPSHAHPHSHSNTHTHTHICARQLLFHG
jgi:hypothetical protein